MRDLKRFLPLAIGLSIAGCGSDGGSLLWPADATRLIANNHGGGFAPSPPPGSTCAIGESHYTLTVIDRKLVWHLCESAAVQAPLAFMDGERTLTPAELDGVVKPLQKMTLAQNKACGADKPVLDMKIATPAGETEYLDSFYQCNKQGIYVDGMDAVFAALRPLVL